MKNNALNDVMHTYFLVDVNMCQVVIKLENS